MKGKVLIFGTLPPPIGGVTISVKNVIKSFENEGYETVIFSLSTFIYFLFKKYKLTHINYSKPWKILIASFLSKLCSKNTVFVVHGNDFNKDYILNKISLKLIDHIVTLNKQVYFSLEKEKCNILLHTPIYKEGVDIDNRVSMSTLFKKEKNKKYLLIYINDRFYINGEDVYGLPFLLKAMKNYNEKYIIVIVDINNKYEEELKDFENYIYFKKPIDFSVMLNSIDIYIRPTANDGSSLAILEAINNRVPVLASNVVDRPEGVTTYDYNNENDFLKRLDELSNNKLISNKVELNSINDLIIGLK